MVVARRFAAFLLVAFCVTALSCASGTPGGAYLYDTDQDPPKLLDSDIKVKTYRNAKAKTNAEERTIVCRSGRFKAMVVKPESSGEAEISFEDYAAIWNIIHDKEAFRLKSETVDPTGGPYHAIHIAVGKDIGDFSAQMKTSFLGTVSTDTLDRIDIVNEIARILDRAVPLQPRPPQQESQKAPVEAPAPAPKS